MKLVQRFSSVGLGFSLLLFLSACAATPVSLTVQRGSTMIVPLTNAALVSNSTTGFGGSEVPDPQRGEIEYFLVDPSNTANPPNLDDPAVAFKLDTRVSTLLASAPSSEAFRQSIPLSDPSYTLPPLQITSLVDIPLGAPLGQRQLWARRVRGGQVLAAPQQLHDIWIMKESVTFSDNGQTYTVDGQSTPMSFGGTISQSGAETTIPDPVFVVPLPQTAYGAVVTVSTGGNAEVLDVIAPLDAPLRNQPLVQIQEFYPGVYLVQVVATNPAGFDELDLVFRLPAGSTTPVDPQTVTVTAQFAWDQYGAPIDGSILPQGTVLDVSGVR